MDANSQVTSKLNLLLSKCKDDDGESQVDELLDRLQDIWSIVKQTTDLGLYAKDLTGLTAVSQKVYNYAQKMDFSGQGLTLTPKEVELSIAKYMEHSLVENEAGGYDECDFNLFNWMKLGLLYYQHSRRPVELDFLNGPLEVEKRVIERRARAVDDTGSQRKTQAASIRAEDLADDENSNTAKMVRKVFITFMEKDDSEKYGGVHFCKFFIDPDSFAQLVENLFYTSFLVRDSRIRLVLEDGEPIVRISPGGNNGDEGQRLQLNHHILLFDYSTWKQMIIKYSISELYLGHREETSDS